MIMIRSGFTSAYMPLSTNLLVHLNGSEPLAHDPFESDAMQLATPHHGSHVFEFSDCFIWIAFRMSNYPEFHHNKWLEKSLKHTSSQLSLRCTLWCKSSLKSVMATVCIVVIIVSIISLRLLVSCPPPTKDTVMINKRGRDVKQSDPLRPAGIFLQLRRGQLSQTNYRTLSHLSCRVQFKWTRVLLTVCAAVKAVNWNTNEH